MYDLVYAVFISFSLSLCSFQVLASVIRDLLIAEFFPSPSSTVIRQYK